MLVDILAEDDCDRPSNQPRNFCAHIPNPYGRCRGLSSLQEAVLPLLPEFNGRLERRMRNPDGTVEIHIVSYASDADRQNYRNDPRRAAQAWLLEKSSAKLESIPMANVS